MQYNLHRNANVDVTASFDKRGHPLALITINNQYEHQFDPNSRVSKALSTMTEPELSAKLTGGDYFMVNDSLVDFRNGDYNGFVHTDASIDQLVDTIGIQTDLEHYDSGLKLTNMVDMGNAILGKKWSDHSIVVPKYHEGGKYSSELFFSWNPFVKTINSAYMLYRLLCDNGMMGKRSFMNTKIPLVNRWHEHLDIANIQIQNKVQNMVSNRLGEMGDERATVAETIMIANHAQKRMKSGNYENMDTLHNILNIVSPEMHLEEYYTEEVFTNMHVANQLPSHLSAYDVYNMATEIRSHSNENATSTTHALDNFSNRLIFDKRGNQTTSLDNSKAPSLNAFSDPDQAFFGKLVA